MADFTFEQIKSFRNLAQKYNAEVFKVLANSSWSSISVKNDAEAALMEDFSQKICRMVLNDYPEYGGKHADINADAEMITFMIADVLAEYREGGKAA